MRPQPHSIMLSDLVARLYFPLHEWGLARFRPIVADALHHTATANLLAHAFGHNFINRILLAVPR
jgi:hypothetical protein